MLSPLIKGCLLSGLKGKLLIYLISVNILTFFCFALDKKKARTKSWRISEKSLLALSLIGGSLGGVLAMALFSHKTKKTSFKLAMALALASQLSILYLLWQKGLGSGS